MNSVEWYLWYVSLVTELLALTKLSWAYNLHLTTHCSMSQSPDEAAHFPPPPCFPLAFHSLLPATADTERLPSSSPLRGGFPPSLSFPECFLKECVVYEKSQLRKYPARFLCVYMHVFNPWNSQFLLTHCSSTLFFPPYISSLDHHRKSLCRKGVFFLDLLKLKMSPGGCLHFSDLHIRKKVVLWRKGREKWAQSVSLFI